MLCNAQRPPLKPIKDIWMIYFVAFYHFVQSCTILKSRFNFQQSKIGIYVKFKLDFTNTPGISDRFFKKIKPIFGNLSNNIIINVCFK